MVEVLFINQLAVLELPESPLLNSCLTSLIELVDSICRDSIGDAIIYDNTKSHLVGLYIKISFIFETNYTLCGMKKHRKSTNSVAK